MTKTWPASAETTYGLFYCKIQFPSDVEFKKWQSSPLDLESAGVKAKLAPLSKIWMNEFPRTTLFEKKLKKPLTVEGFLQFLKDTAASGKEFFDIKQNQNSMEMSGYLGSYEAIEDYAELLFLILILAGETQAEGNGFLFPDNYYFDFYNFIAIEMTPGSGIHLECDDTQNADEDLAAKVEELEPVIKESYIKWLK